MYYAPKSGLGFVELLPSIVGSVFGLGTQMWAGNKGAKEAERLQKLKNALTKEEAFQDARTQAQLQTISAQEQLNAEVAKKSLEVKIMLGAVAGVAVIVAGVFVVSALRRKKK